MEYNLLNNLQYCYQFFLDSQGLLYYTHIPAIVASLLFGGYVLLKRRDLASVLLAVIAVIFSIYSTLDLLQWIYIEDNTFIMSSWAELGLLSVLLFFFTNWFVHVSITERPLPAWMATVWTVAFLPILIFTPTTANLIGYNIRDCIAIEGTWFTNYYYGLGILAMVLMAVSAFQGLRKKNVADYQIRSARVVIFAGAELFTFSFLVTGVVASYLVDQGYIPDFGLSQYGMAAMTIFVGILAYATTRYHAFNIKLVATQALVVSLVILVAAEFLFVTNPVSYVLTGITLFSAIIFGWFLVRSVKREIEQREHIEELAGELAKTNERQETLIHFIGHEVKGSLTKDAGAFAALAEGDFGVLPDTLKPFVEHALTESRQSAGAVENILKAANLKKGTVTYTKATFDLKALVGEAVEKAKSSAEQKGLNLSFTTDEGSYEMTGDRAQIGDHVLRNLIDNSINYTPTGSVAVSLEKTRDKSLNKDVFVFKVKDTGVGITDEDKKLLFTEGGHGKESQKVNVHSTGYGLYIAKQIVEAHGGTIRAESEGAGKGSTFIVEFPT